MLYQKQLTDPDPQCEYCAGTGEVWISNDDTSACECRMIPLDEDDEYMQLADREL